MFISSDTTFSRGVQGFLDTGSAVEYPVTMDPRIIITPRDYLLTADSQPGFVLENGQSLKEVRVRYETYGPLNDEKSNAILFCHAFSGDAHLLGYHTAEDRYPGWWDGMVGPGKPFDTNRFHVICSNVLGGCMGTTGPASLNPDTAKPYGMDFPYITIGDMVKVQKHLIDHLGISQLYAVVGGSMGGMQVLEWAVRYPDRLKKAFVLASTPRLTAQGIAFNAVGRNAIVSDPHWNKGNYYGGPVPATGLSIARMVGHITYLSDESMRQKFGRKRKAEIEDLHLSDRFEVEGYLRYQGQKFVERFDANSYIYLSRAVDHFDLGAEEGGLETVFSRVQAEFMILSYSSDWLFPTWQSKEMVAALMKNGKKVSFAEIRSPYGHDAFLLETQEQKDLITAFLEPDNE